jgi:hypothetical protein
VFTKWPPGLSGDGVGGPTWGWLAQPQGVRKLSSSRALLERATKEGDSPVGERARTPVRGSLSTTEHANSVGSRGDHTPRLKTSSDR